MSEAENQEPVCSSNAGESRVGKLEDEAEQDNEAEAKAGNSPLCSPSGDADDCSSADGVRRNEPDLVSSSKESPGPAGGGGQPQIRNNNEIRVRENAQDYDDDDDDSNDEIAGGTNNGDRELFNAQICSPYSLAPSSNSKSNPFGSAAQQNILRGPILRPSAFKFSAQPPQQQQQQQSSSGFVLRPPKLIPNSGSVGCKIQAQATSTTSTLQFVPLEKDESEEGAKDEVLLKKPENPAAGSAASAEAFVFGSNLEERAVQGSPPSGKKRKIEGGEEQVTEVLSSGGVKKPSVVISGEEASAGDPVREVITGEEGEVNVLQLHCRLFIFDNSNSTWVERGRGLLRINDDTRGGSRLIIRSKGSLRVMLNTKVWDGMRVEKVGDKNVRIMAVDLESVDKDGKEMPATVRIFLIMTTSISDAYTLVNALESRVRRLTN